jgi:1-hydroxycarotenoid 3,4-desaturase
MDLASRGARVTVFERSEQVGGKMRREEVGGVRIDAGPTVLTMLGVFEELFRAAGHELHELIRVHPLERLARHAWPDGTRFDLYRDEERSAAEIEKVFGPKEAENYRLFAAHCRAVYERVKGPFIESERPGLRSAWKSGGLRGISDMMRVDWHRSMWSALNSMLETPHLRQLFARYATYYGSSPYAAPATLNLIAEVERAGVWVVEGGMHELALAMERVLTHLGARVELETHIDELRFEKGCWEVCKPGGSESFDAVVFNGDLRALAGGSLGPAVRKSVRTTRKPPSSSALTWCAQGQLSGEFEADFHNVFFSEDYRAEFDAVFGEEARLPESPSVYLCAQSRAPGAQGPTSGGEALFILANAPASSDRHQLTQKDIEGCEAKVHQLMQRCGLELDWGAAVQTAPGDFSARFPGSRGALYGTVTHSPFAPFARPTSRSRLPGLYLAGGGRTRERGSRWLL